MFLQSNNPQHQNHSLSPRSSYLLIGGKTFNITQDGYGCTYSVSPASQSVPATGASGSVSVTASNGCSWTAASSAGWIILNSGASGSGSGQVTYTVAANSGTTSRTGALTVAGKTVTINQAGGSAPCTYAISPTSQSVPATGAAGAVNVSAPGGCNWTAQSNAGWITLSYGASGSGNGQVSYSVGANSGTSSRTGTLTIAGQTMTVSQAGGSSPCTYSISPASQSVPAAGTTAVVSVTAPGGCNWTAQSNASWISINYGANGSGSGQVNYTVGANSGTASRTGTLTIAGQTMTISQSGGSNACTYSVDPMEQTFGPAGGSGTLAVTAPGGCAWKAQSYSSWWLPVTGGFSGSGTGTVRFTVDPNPSYAARSSMIAVGDKLVKITQEGQGCSFAVSPTFQSIPASGASASVNVTSPGSCSWTAESNVNWIEVFYGANGLGIGRIYYRAEPNSGASPRTGTLTIAGKTITINQAGAVSRGSRR